MTMTTEIRGDQLKQNGGVCGTNFVIATPSRTQKEAYGLVLIDPLLHLVHIYQK